MATSSNLENLAKIGKLKAEAPAQSEIDGLVASGRKRFNDAKNPAITLDAGSISLTPLHMPSRSRSATSGATRSSTRVSAKSTKASLPNSFKSPKKC